MDLFVLGAVTFLRKWNNRTEAVLNVLCSWHWWV